MRTAFLGSFVSRIMRSMLIAEVTPIPPIIRKIYFPATGVNDPKGPSRNAFLPGLKFFHLEVKSPSTFAVNESKSMVFSP